MKKLLTGVAALAFLAGGAAWAQTVTVAPPVSADSAMVVPSPVMQPGHPMPPPPPRMITVSGESHAEFPPDQAVLSMSLVTKDKNLDAAKQANDALTARLVTIARGFDIPREKIANSSVSIAPEYRYDNTSAEQQFIGYSVSRSFRVTMNAATETPEKLLSAIVGAGIDQVDGVQYMLSDPKAQETPLQVKAFEDAKIRAEALAKAAGGTLGPVLALSTVDEAPPMPPRPMPMMARAGVSQPSVAPTLPGIIDLHSSVTATFALE